MRVASISAFSRSGESGRSEEHTSELQSPCNLVCRLLLENKNSFETTKPMSDSLHTRLCSSGIRRRLHRQLIHFFFTHHVVNTFNAVLPVHVFNLLWTTLI